MFERGTELDAGGLPLPGSRALPDGEIVAGTPIPAIVPIPNRPMPPMPGDVTVVDGSALDPPLPGSQINITEAIDPATELYARNPGYPFFMPGIAGHRIAQPPLDMEFDRGLPRHIITAGTTSVDETTRLSFDKVLGTADAIELLQDGTTAEKTAMAFHAQRFHDTYNQKRQPAQFRTNGQPPVAGAPYAEPCINDMGEPVTTSMREYRVAAIQLDIVMNKVGWHFPQSRILALNEDVADTLNGTRPPEPLFFRANTDDCITYYHTNLIPNIYEMDDFQVRTPTDIIGQHIHLVKFDVTSSDGSGNGFNYEDGTFSPQEVEERIAAINAGGGLIRADTGLPDNSLLAQENPAFIGVPGVDAHGVQTTIQRWFADDVLNNSGKDRTLRTVFTHDHFGPSTHQQAGLYASLVLEPKGSTWQDPESNVVYGSRADGGPTSWRADIITGDLDGDGQDDSYREFMFQFADFVQAYKAGTGGGPFGGGGPPVADPDGVVNPPIFEFVGLPFLLDKLNNCPQGDFTIGPSPPCPEAIMANDPGTYVVNYRNEPIALRILDPALADADHPEGQQAIGDAGNLAYAYRSDITRAIPELNSATGNAPYPALTNGVLASDPYTPLMRIYDGDNVQIRVQVGATEESHNMTAHGLNWLQDPSSPNSGYRNSQSMGISEHFEFKAPILPVTSGGFVYSDRLYTPDSSLDGQWNGLWGLLRSYSFLQTGNDRLDPLHSNNQIQANVAIANRLVLPEPFNGVCPESAPLRTFDITAVAAENALPGGTLIYNTRDTLIPGASIPDPADPTGPPIILEPVQGPLHDPTAIMYVHSSDLAADGTLKPAVPIEPMVLRANAGDCIELTLTNALPQEPLSLLGYNTLPPIVERFNGNEVAPSNRVGLHPQLLAFDAVRHNGVDVGRNRIQAGNQLSTAGPGESVTYRWYAGTLEEDASNVLIATPAEFGATALMPADPIKHPEKGAVGMLIVEPQNAIWDDDYAVPKPGYRRTRTAATVYKADGVTVDFREFALVAQDSVNLYGSDPAWTPVRPTLVEQDDVEDSGKDGFNYRTEPFWFRLGFAPDHPLTGNRADWHTVLSNTAVGGDPQTPVFRASAGTPTRLRLVHPGGHQRNHVFSLHGHAWQQMPYTADSTQIGDNPLSEVKGAQAGIGPTEQRDFVLENGAGGAKGVKGDYLFRDGEPNSFSGGMWGIMRVTQ